MRNELEKLHERIAVSAVTGKPIKHKSLVGLSAQVIACDCCNGTGLLPMFKGETIYNTKRKLTCDKCNGRAFLTVAKKPITKTGSQLNAVTIKGDNNGR